MTSSPAPEFDTFFREFITSHARSIFAAFPPSEHNDETEPLVFTVYSNLIGDPIKSGPFPASKSSIESLPTVTVTPEDDCAICLTEYGVSGETKEMPCKHRYHSDCIMKWLGIHGSCPVCRYEMPVDEEEKRRSDGGVGWQVVVVVVMVTSGGPVSELDRSGVESESDERLIEDMEIDLGDSMEDLD